MESLESPLNVAHRHAKKAEQLTKHGQKMDEVMTCHKTAAENILLAMEMSTSVYARESLLLQHNYHVKHSDMLHQAQCMRDHRAAATQAKLTHKRSSQGDKSAVNTASPLDNHGSDILGEDMTDYDTETVFKSLADTDTLLQFLDRRTTDNLSVKNLERLYGQSDTSNYQRVIRNATKQPKTDRVIIEELRIHNESLRSHIVTLINELEAERSKKLSLQQTLDSRDTNSTLFSDNANTPEPGIHLPPLEIPKFDFESLKTEIDDVDNNG